MYTKDFASLLELLSVSGQSGTLIVEQPDYEGTPWQAQLMLVEGNVTTCLLRSKVDGRILLRDAEATRWLSTRGKLYWNLEESSQDPITPLPQAIAGPSTDPALPSQPAQTAQWFTIIPRRTPRGEQAVMSRAWSREHRLIFALIDGRRTITEIAALLHKPPDHVVQVLNDLRAEGFIA